MSFHMPNQFRITWGPLASDPSIGNNGAFAIGKGRDILLIIASDGEGWEHVSVSHRYDTPTWDEMCKVKNMFWDEDDCVIQFHPPKSEYINDHPHCLHLWRPIGVNIPRPPMELIGRPNDNR